QYGRVADLKLDSRLEKKSREQAKRKYRPSLSLSAGGKRASRKEQVAVYEAPPADEEMLFADDALIVEGATPEGASVSEIAAARVVDSPRTRVRLFESEIDPMSFEVLDEAHFVLYRNVWREGERIIQGAVIRRAPFIREMIEAAYENAAVSAMSNLVTAYQGEVLAAFAGHAREYLPGASGLAAELLYRVRLSSPLSDLELIYSVTELPLGPSVRFLAWMGLALLAVLTGGCYAMYRFGVGQMALYRQQQDFVSAVSHELKTPLTSIRMYSEMLKKGWADEDKKAGYYAFIHDESERLSRLIANILQLARMTRGKVGIELREIGVDVLLDTVDPKLASQVQSGGFELQRNYAENALEASVTLDGDAFTQILINLVDNAIKFSSGNGQKRIDFVCIRQSDDRIRFTVRDYGPGIERDQMRKIFELFYRSENELTRETVGTGIGLALVHQLTLAMNGRVDVINRDPGAEFSLTFPIAITGSE
ncbi:MAG: HAMP domain-containing sensor histidine kinase, partial [Gammaproteobacteria bacterium]|nr:HAMP domain-containing sensor histidine kinase [Gammaproteobacteria bacterium]